MNYRVGLIILAMLCMSRVNAQTYEELFNKMTATYDAGDYPKVITLLDEADKKSNAKHDEVLLWRIYTERNMVVEVYKDIPLIRNLKNHCKNFYAAGYSAAVAGSSKSVEVYFNNICREISDISLNEDYIKAASTTDVAERLSLMTKAANAGDVVAMYALGAYYATDDKDYTDYVTAWEWHSKAAKKNYGKSMFAMAMLINSKKAEGSLPEMVKLFQSGADLGEPYCQVLLGDYMSFGLAGLQPSYEKMMKLYDAAADVGIEPAMQRIASKQGKTFEDPVEARKWYVNNWKMWSGKSGSVKIGKQEWMTDDLDVYAYQNGDLIPFAPTDDEWQECIDKKIGCWTYKEAGNPYTANDANDKKLYNWYALHDNRGLAPKGWHVPSKEEWEELSDPNQEEHEVRVKEIAKLRTTTGWPDGKGNNSLGFNATPSSYRFKSYSGFGYEPIGKYAFWWSTSENEKGDVDVEAMSDSMFDVARSKNCGLAVRCIKSK